MHNICDLVLSSTSLHNISDYTTAQDPLHRGEITLINCWRSEHGVNAADFYKEAAK